MATQKQVADTAAAAAEQAYQRTLQAAAPRWRRSKNDGAQVFANALGFDSRVLEWQNEYDQWTEYDPAVAQLALTNLWKGVMQTQFKAGNKQDYTLDLSTMQQTNHKHGTARALRWVQTQSSGGSHRDHYPDYWDLSQLPSDPTQFATVKLSPLSQTFKDAEQLFKSTAPSSLGIVSIEAIQHSLRWKAFQFKRDMIETALHARGGARESKCFHGTSHANVDQISACRFLCDYNQASAYGKGTYFARDASYSCQTAYSKPNQHGEQVMFLVGIILGASCLGTNGKAKPDVKPGSRNQPDF